MLGLGPVSSRAISGSPFKLTAVNALFAATVSISLTLTVVAGQTVSAGAQLPFSISFAGALQGRQAVGITLPFSISLDGILREFGKPFIITALPQSYALRATVSNYTLKALPQSFTLRGVK